MLEILFLSVLAVLKAAQNLPLDNWKLISEYLPFNSQKSLSNTNKHISDILLSYPISHYQLFFLLKNNKTDALTDIVDQLKAGNEVSMIFQGGDETVYGTIKSTFIFLTFYDNHQYWEENRFRIDKLIEIMHQYKHRKNLFIGRFVVEMMQAVDINPVFWTPSRLKVLLELIYFGVGAWAQDRLHVRTKIKLAAIRYNFCDIVKLMNFNPHYISHELMIKNVNSKEMLDILKEKGVDINKDSERLLYSDFIKLVHWNILFLKKKNRTIFAILKKSLYYAITFDNTELAKALILSNVKLDYNHGEHSKIKFLTFLFIKNLSYPLIYLIMSIQLS
jgi:hypothetical protein